MRVKILKADLIELLPDTDADQALLAMWSEQTARQASSSMECFPDGRNSYAVRVQFKERQTNDQAQ